jgi:hypothetical protein
MLKTEDKLLYPKASNPTLRSETKLFRVKFLKKSQNLKKVIKKPGDIANTTFLRPAVGDPKQP